MIAVGMAHKDVEKPWVAGMEMITQCSDAPPYPCTHTHPTSLSSSLAEIGELKCTLLRFLSFLASALNLVLNVNYLGVKFARQSVVKASCLLHTLFLLTNKLGRH